MSSHAFLAVEPSDEERHGLAASLMEANPGGPVPGRRPAPENWHVTLRFLGDCSSLQAEMLMYELGDSIQERHGRVFASGVDAFPRASKAGVLFVPIRDDSGLLDVLAGRCEDAAREIGFDPEERPFVPHITIARLRPAQDLRRVIGSFATFSVPIDVAAVTLFRTHRTREGVGYEAIDRIDLKV